MLGEGNVENSYKIILVSRGDSYHIVSPDYDGRISRQIWQSFIGYLKLKFSHKLNWNIYENTPVYEYYTSVENLKYAIDNFIMINLKGKVDFEISHDNNLQENRYSPSDLF